MAKPRETKRAPENGRTEPETTELAARIARAKGERPGETAAEKARRWELSAAGRGYRLAAEFVAAILVGAGLGWGVDQLFGTTPWGLIVLLLFGFAAGVLNVMRASAEMNAEQARRSAQPAAKNDEDD